MSWGQSKYFDYTVPAGATQTTALFDLERTWNNLQLQIPTMASSTGIDVYVALEKNNGDAGSYYQYAHHDDSSNTPSFTVAASASVNGRVVELHGGVRYVKLVLGSAPTAAVTFAVQCSRQGMYN